MRCVSGTGEVLVLSEADFNKRMASNSRTLSVVLGNCDQKTKAITELLANSKTLHCIDERLRHTKVPDMATQEPVLRALSRTNLQ